MSSKDRVFCGRVFLAVDNINRLLESQQRFDSMLTYNDGIYSQNDLRMLIDNGRDKARDTLLQLYSERLGDGDFDKHDISLILHAAAELKLSPENMVLLVRDHACLASKRFEGPCHCIYPQRPSESTTSVE